MTKFNVPITVAWEATNAEGNIRGLYARVARWREKQQKESAAHGLLSLTSQETPSSLSSASVETSSFNDGSTNSSQRGSSTRELLPLWMDPDKTAVSMAKRPKRRQEEVARDQYRKKIDNHVNNTKYSRAFKTATLEIGANLANPDLYGKRGYGIRSIVDRVNETMLSSPNNKKLSRSAIERAVSCGKFGVSPPRRGRPAIVPNQLTYALATHSTMMQIAGEGEASAIKMKTVASALMANTNHKNKVMVDWIWRKMRLQHPELMNPVTAKNHEDRRVDWLTFKNIIDWNLRAKKFLVDIGMAEDKRGEICVYHPYLFIFSLVLLNLTCILLLQDGVESEVSLFHPDDCDHFITLDETHHPLSTEGNKGGSTTRRYANASFPRSGNRVVKSEGHISGLYGYTLRGESLPPLYIISTRSECPDNYKLDTKICEGLPRVNARYGAEIE